MSFMNPIFSNNWFFYMSRVLPLLVLFFLAPLTTKATHIVGGEMGYKYLGDNRYQIFLYVYRDCQTGQENFDNPAFIGMYDGNRQLIRRYEVGFVAADTLSAVVLDECYELPQPVCVERTLYSIEITASKDPVGGKYIFTYQRCCRNAGVQNINDPLETGAAYSVELTKLAIEKGNSTPTFKAWPPTFICLDEPIRYDHGAVDNNDAVNERMRYSLCTPYSAGTYNNPKPRPSTILPGFDSVYWNTAGGFSLNNVLGTNVDKMDIAENLSIDSVTGVMSGVPTIQGKFVVGICMEEFDENGNLLSVVKRDFQYNVDRCSEAFVLTIDASATCSEDLKSYSVDFSTNSPEVWVSSGDLIQNGNGGYQVTNVPLDSAIRIRAIDETINCILEETTLAPECLCESKPPVPVPEKTTDVAICFGDPMPELQVTTASGFVADWYDAPVGGNLLAEATATFSPPAVGTYYAEGRRALDGCTSATRESLRVTVNEMPSLQMRAEPICSRDFSTYQVVFVSNAVNIRVSQGVFSDMPGDSFVVASIPVDSALEIFISNSSGTCEISELVNTPQCDCDDVVINPPTTAVDTLEICVGSLLPELQVQVAADETADWYDTPSGGSRLATGTLLFRPDAPGTYYAEARNIGSGCGSKTRTAITIVVNPLPELELTGEGSVCEENFDEYEVSFRTNGDRVFLSQGTLITLSPNSYQAKNIPIGEVLVINAVISATNCVSILRVSPPVCNCNDFPVAPPQVLAGELRVCEGEALPELIANVPSGVTVDWYSSQTGGTRLATGTDRFTPPAAGTYFAEARKLMNDCVSSSRTPVSLIVNPLPAITLLAASTVCASDLMSYSVEVSTTGDSMVVSAGNLQQIAAGRYKVTGIPSGTNIQARAYFRSTGCSRMLSISDPACSCSDIVVSAPVALFTDTTICADGAFPVMEVRVESGETVDWYGSAAGSDLLLSGSAVFTPSKSGVFYAETRRTDTNCTSNSRTPVELKINPLPEVDIIGSGTLCAPDLLSYSVIFLTDGDMVSVSAGTLQYDEDNLEYTVRNIPVGTSLRIFSTIATTGCSRVFEVVSPACPCDPEAIDPPAVANAEWVICADEPLPFFDAFVGSGETVDWYGSATGDDTIAIGSRRFQPTGAGTWFAETRVTANGCTSATRTRVRLVVHPLPEIRLADDGLVCNPNLITYSASFLTDHQPVSVSAGDLERIGTGQFRIKNIPVGQAVRILVRDTLTLCENILDVAAPNCPTCEDFVINPPGTSNPVVQICEGDAIPSLQVIVQSGETVDWYTASTGGQLITSNTLGFKPPGAGTFYAETRVVVNGCTSTTRTPVTLVINNLPVISFVEGSTACAEDLLSYSIRFSTDADSVSVSAGVLRSEGGRQYEIAEIPANRSVNITAVFKATGCKTTLSAQQPSCTCENIVVAPPVVATSTQTICAGEPLPVFTATVGANETVDWYNAPFGGTVLASGTLTFQPSEAGTYFAETRRNDTGCVSGSRTPIVVNVLDLPEFSLTAAGKVCSEDLKTWSFSFTSNATDVSVSVGEVVVKGGRLFEVKNIPALSAVTITLADDRTGCQRIETLASAVCPCDPEKVPVPVAVIDSFFICPGDPMPELEVMVGEGETVDWYATPTGGVPLARNTKIFQPATGGTYYAENRLVVINCPSAVRTPITVVLYDLPTFEPAVEGPECAIDFETYSIAFTTDADLVDVDAGILQKIATGSYQVINIPKASNLTVYLTSSETGCSTTGEVSTPGCTIECREPFIFVPSAFSPNGDGRNDLYRVRSEVVETMRMVIYNRWGQEVYVLDDIDETWDGSYRGRPLPPDVYGYFLTAVCYDGQVFTKKGNISLLR